MKKTFLAALLVSAGGLALAPLAHADLISIGLQQAGVNGGAITTEVTGSAGVSIGAPITYGTFTLNTVNAFDTLGLGNPLSLLNSQSINTSSSKSGTLNVWVTVQGLTSPSGPASLLSSFTTNGLPNGWTLTMQDYIDPLGGVYNTNPLTLISTHTFAGQLTNDTFDETKTVNFVSGYSFTEKYTITAVGGGNTNDTIDTSVPEPGSLALLGTALIGIGAVGWSRRRRA